MTTTPDITRPPHHAALAGSRILVVGGRSGIAADLAATAAASGADVVLAGRRPETLAATAARTGASTVRIDLADEDSIIAAARRLGPVDHVVSLAADPANGPLADLDAAAVRSAFDAKVVGPMMLARHLAPVMRDGGSFLFFSGVAAWRPSPGRAVMATTNGAVSFLVEALAVELAPLRVNALSPGIVDSGAWDAMGDDDRRSFFDATAAKNPSRRVGSPSDVTSAALLALTNPFVTGTTLHVDGGGRLA